MPTQYPEDSNPHFDMNLLSRRLKVVRQKVDSGLELDDSSVSSVIAWSEEGKKLGERLAEILEPYSFDLYIEPENPDNKDSPKSIEVNCVHPIQVKAVKNIAHKLMVVLVHYHQVTQLSISLNNEVVGSIHISDFLWTDIPVTSLLSSHLPDWISIEELASRMLKPLPTLLALCESFGIKLKCHDPSAPEQLGLTQRDLFFLASGINFCTIEAMSTEIDKDESLRDD